MKFRAVCRKFRVVNRTEKIKLLMKLSLRPFGVKKPLFLGGYVEEEDRRQQQSDEELLAGLRSERENAGGVPESLAPGRIQQGTSGEEASWEPREWTHSYIALVTQSLDKGGLEEVVRQLAMQMCERGIPVRVFCMQSGGKIAEELRAGKIEVLCFEGDREKLRAYCMKERPAIVNSHYVLENMDVFGQLGIPVVEVIHNMYVFQTRDGLHIEKEKAFYVKHYIAVSEKAKEIFLHKVPGVAKDRVTVIGNTLQGKKPDRSREEMRKELGISPETEVFITVGSLDARKNQIGILRAWDIFRRLTDKKVLLIMVGGSTDYEYGKKVDWLIGQRNLQESVLFTGQSDAVSDLLNASDFFVLNSYYEGWSVAATEALGSGLPLIHSDCGSGRELTAGGSCGILIDNPLNRIEDYDSFSLYDVMHAGINEHIDQLVEAMLAMSDHRDEWMAQRDAIKEYAEVHFSGSKVLDRYLEVFESVLGTREQ